MSQGGVYTEFGCDVMGGEFQMAMQEGNNRLPEVLFEAMNQSIRFPDLLKTQSLDHCFHHPLSYYIFCTI